MATLYTHAAVGLGLGKLFTDRPMPWSFWLLAGVLPCVPDLDGFSTYGSEHACGHRGLTHSLCFAALLGCVTALATFRAFKLQYWPLAGIYFAIAASHMVLDALTSGGSGVAVFWPISSQRFGPYGPIHVADIGAGWPNPWTSRAIRTELLYVWLPMGLLLAVIAGCRRWAKGGIKRNG
jgi:inner membrane protein